MDWSRVVLEIFRCSAGEIATGLDFWLVVAAPSELGLVGARWADIRLESGTIPGNLDAKMIFYLGTHQVNWLGWFQKPLMVSRRRLSFRKTFPKAIAPWVLDSGGFTELNLYGHWTVSPQSYADEARRFSDSIGNLQWAAIQDWMCEPMIREKTKKTVKEHQQRTVDNYLLLRRIAPEMPWMPVLQGWDSSEYFDHVGQYFSSGVDLTQIPIVGLGSVCRRQGTELAVELIRDLASLGIRLHAFGFKIRGLQNAASYLASANSMAWSFAARNEEPLEGCMHQSCANCPRYARRWLDHVERLLDATKKQGRQQFLF